eukprot:scaffold72874_cov30-Tisochrysis_lutea.AAC.4
MLGNDPRDPSIEDRSCSSKFRSDRCESALVVWERIETTTIFDADTPPLQELKLLQPARSNGGGPHHEFERDGAFWHKWVAQDESCTSGQRATR